MRLSRLFEPKRGRSVIVAVDHGIAGVPPGLEFLGDVLEDIIAEQPDGVLMTMGAFRHYYSLFTRRTAPSIIVAGDMLVTGTLPGRTDCEEHRLVISVEEAVALGADAVKILLVFGREDARVHARNIELISRLADDCGRYGMPLMIEPTLWGALVPKDRQDNPDLIRHIARIAMELGADIIKLPMPRSESVLEEICASLPIPVTVLGGAKREGLDEVFRVAKDSIDHGARGIVFGRNVWNSPNRRGVIRALKAVVHDGVDVTTAVQISGDR
jgi:class I fructose-bisphosphate aldolase